jgi:hypothetical protein
VVSVWDRAISNTERLNRSKKTVLGTYSKMDKTTVGRVASFEAKDYTSYFGKYNWCRRIVSR